MISLGCLIDALGMINGTIHKSFYNGEWKSKSLWDGHGVKIFEGFGIDG